MRIVYGKLKSKELLENLSDYGFWKTSPKDANPWYQCTFNMVWTWCGTWDCQILVHRDTLEVFVDIDNDDVNTTKLYDTLEQMMNDGIIERLVNDCDKSNFDI